MPSQPALAPSPSDGLRLQLGEHDLEEAIRAALASALFPLGLPPLWTKRMDYGKCGLPSACCRPVPHHAHRLPRPRPRPDRRPSPHFFNQAPLVSALRPFQPPIYIVTSHSHQHRSAHLRRSGLKGPSHTNLKASSRAEAWYAVPVLHLFCTAALLSPHYHHHTTTASVARAPPTTTRRHFLHPHLRKPCDLLCFSPHTCTSVASFWPLIRSSLRLGELLLPGWAVAHRDWTIYFLCWPSYASHFLLQEGASLLAA